MFCVIFTNGVTYMYYVLLSFNDVPKIGFAHHFYAENYSFTRKKRENTMEIVYVKEGDLEIALGEKNMLAPKGSVFVFMRSLPFAINTKKGSQHAHCTVQLISDFNFEIARTKEEIPSDFKGLIMPVITPPGKTAEAIKKKLCTIVSDISVSREKNGFSSSLCALGMLEDIHSKFKSEFLHNMQTSSILCYKIKKYISEHLCESLSLADISKSMGKTSIYLNSVFKKETGTTIGQYINSEKTRLVAELMLNKGLPFKKACESAGISDISYGYRVFKKQMGVTPGEYKGSQRFSK